MSLLTLPEPTGWRSERRRLRRATLAAAALIAAGVFTGTHRLVVGDHVGAVVGYSFVVPFILLVAAQHVLTRGHTSLRNDCGSTGMTLLPDRKVTALLLVSIGSFIPIGIYFVIVTGNGSLDLTGFRHGRFGALILGVSLVCGVIAGLIVAWRRGGIGYVKLTPSGIDIADIKSTDSVLWDDVTAVDDHSESNKKTRKAIVLRLDDGTEKTIDGADFYVPNGVGLYWMVRHYFGHPDDRVELTDDRALQRLHDGRFDLG
jgi:hypothetical protein